MKRRDPHQWAKTRLNDPFFIKAKQEGYRARSAYKLLEIIKKNPGLAKGNVLDLGAAPGAWSQILVKSCKVDAIDLLEIIPINGVNFIKADIFSEAATKFFQKYDTIFSDIAPNMSGHKTDDHYLHMNLVEKVLDVCIKHLNFGGNVCIKIFDGPDYVSFFQEFRKCFQSTKRIKPEASCLDSSEFYLVGLGFKN
jgi:23S rRNA (uridine2552-2'-O)-methyltransferase